MREPRKTKPVSDRQPSNALGLAGLVFAMAPALLFATAAFLPLGPASATYVFAAPVILSTAASTVIAVLLFRRGARGWGRAVAWTTAIAGAVAYVAWIGLALLGVSRGDGPL